jgi:hypothetical protein
VYSAAVADRFTVYGVCTAFQVAGTLLTTGLMFISKMNMVKSAKERSQGSGTSSGRRTGTVGFGPNGSHPTTMSMASSTSGTDHSKLKQKYRDAKKENAKLRERLGLTKDDPLTSSESESSSSSSEPPVKSPRATQKPESDKAAKADKPKKSAEK